MSPLLYELSTLISWKTKSTMMIRIQKMFYLPQKIAEREKKFSIVLFLFGKFTSHWTKVAILVSLAHTKFFSLWVWEFFCVLFFPNRIKFIQNNGINILIVYRSLSLRSNLCWATREQLKMRHFIDLLSESYRKIQKLL